MTSKNFKKSRDKFTGNTGNGNLCNRCVSKPSRPGIKTTENSCEAPNGSQNRWFYETKLT